MEKILDVRNLCISFKTNNGLVKAVRNISFSLNKGETLAIVGESGSGKSVTSRALMGILAGNAVVESGEIFYDGKDLIRISENDYHQLRGNKISMIFQDPFSSLNPIVRVGKQLTEAMILNGRANQRDARREFNQKIRLLKENVNKAYSADPKNAFHAKEISDKIKQLNQFTAKGNALEKAYNTAREYIETTVTIIEGALIHIKNNEYHDVKRSIHDILRASKHCYNQYLFETDGALLPLVNKLKIASNEYKDVNGNSNIKGILEKMLSLYKEALSLPLPDFFAMGYYVTYNPQSSVATNEIIKLNETMHSYMNENFMDSFINDLKEGIKYSHLRSLEYKQAAIVKLNEPIQLLNHENVNKTLLKKAVNESVHAVEASIDHLSIIKSSIAYTFRTAINEALNSYLYACKINSKNRLTKKQKQAAESLNVDLCKNNLMTILLRIRDSYQKDLKAADRIDFKELAKRMVLHLKDNASKMVYHITNKMAKSRAISLMEEAGISDARERYRQYPFQFSGGMRQRIVIAIALAANPDILICDEPTTALDVTIQAQILDLINSLKVKRQLSVIFITHDLGVVANMADHIAVMYAGKIVEHGKVDEVFYNPAHPYTWALLASMPDLDTKELLESLPGTPPNMIHPPKGDAFAARNKYAMKIDFEKEPPFFTITPTHKAATWLLHPDAPKVELPKIVSERITRMQKLEVTGNE